MSIPAIYSSYSAGYLGITDPAGQTALIHEFRQRIGLSDSDPLPDDLATQALYLDFVQSKLVSAERAETANALSPKEVEARRTAFEVYNIVIAMLKALQQCMKEQGDLLQFYSRWQKEYSDMMTRNPIYGPKGFNRIIVDDTDFGKTTLGYAHISVRDVTEYLFDQTLQNDEGQTPTHTETFFLYGPMDNPDALPEGTTMEGNSIFCIQLKHYGETNTYHLQISINSWSTDSTVDPPVSTAVQTPIFESEVSPSMDSFSGGLLDKERAVLDHIFASMTSRWNSQAYIDASPTVTVTTARVPYRDGTAIKYENIDSLDITRAKLKQWWANVPNPPGEGGTHDIHYGPYSGLWGPWTDPGPGAWPELLPYEADTKPDDLRKIRQDSSTYRSEVNAQLQQYIEGARSKRTVIEDRSKVTQSLIDQTKDALSAQASLLNSIVESLRSLITAIFK